jgi:ABC-type enterochelin transport system substrate-binding protein
MGDFKQIISNKLVLPQNALLNGKIPMDAANYYMQSGDMRDLEALIPNL